MPRPKKGRRVCCMPKVDYFGPVSTLKDDREDIIMSVDEYETIRLIDLEGFNQEECASRMNIARTTVQGIYNVARKKLAEALINGRRLKIEGGNYQLCDGLQKHCGKGRGRRRGCDNPSREENEFSAEEKL